MQILIKSFWEGDVSEDMHARPMLLFANCDLNEKICDFQILYIALDEGTCQYSMPEV